MSVARGLRLVLRSRSLVEGVARSLVEGSNDFPFSIYSILELGFKIFISPRQEYVAPYPFLGG